MKNLRSILILSFSFFVFAKTFALEHSVPIGFYIAQNENNITLVDILEIKKRKIVVRVIENLKGENKKLKKKEEILDLKYDHILLEKHPELDLKENSKYILIFGKSSHKLWFGYRYVPGMKMKVEKDSVLIGEELLTKKGFYPDFDKLLVNDEKFENQNNKGIKLHLEQFRLFIKTIKSSVNCKKTSQNRFCFELLNFKGENRDSFVQANLKYLEMLSCD